MKKTLPLILILIFVPVLSPFLAAQTGVSMSREKLLESFFQKGVNYYIQRDFKSATQEWKKVLEIEPSHQKAKIYFEKAFTKYQDMEKNYYLGLAQFNQGQCEKAIPYFKNTLLINPRHKKALYYLQLSYECIKVHIVIKDKSADDGRQIKDLKLTTDKEISLYALGYDGENKYIGPVEVEWGTTGTLDAITNKEKCTEIKYAPSTFDTKGKITASLDKDTRAETGTISVLRGKLKYVKGLNDAFGMGSPVMQLEITSDDTIRLYAAGYDKNNTYIGDVPVNWHTGGSIDNLTQNNSSAFDFSSSRAGSGRLFLKAKNGYAMVLSNIIVRPGKLDYIQVEYGPERNSEEVYAVKLTTDESITVYSTGYDKNNNRIGGVAVDWQTTQLLDPVRVQNSREFTFKPKKANTYGTIKIEKKGTGTDETGIISVLPGMAQYIYIVNSPDTNFSVWNRLTLRAGDKVSLYAAGFGNKKNMLGLYEVDWRVRSREIQGRFAKKNMLPVAFTNADQVVRIDLSHPKVWAQTNFLIQITPGPARELFLSDVSNRKSTNFFIIRSDEPKKIYAFLTDRYRNIIREPACAWSLKEITGTLSTDHPDYYSVFIPDKVGEGEITAQSTDPGQMTAELPGKTIRVRVVPGSPGKIGVSYADKFVSGPLVLKPQADHQFDSYTLDRNDNVIQKARVEWTVRDDRTNYILNRQDQSITLHFEQAVSNGMIMAVSEGLKTNIMFRTGPGEIVMKTEIETQKRTSDVEQEDLVIYHVYNGDTMCRIISKILQMPYVWARLAPFIHSLAQYNRLSDEDLIFPKQRINIPYFRVEEETTKEELALKIFNDSKKKDLIKIYRKYQDQITPGDKIILLQEDFLRTGKVSITNVEYRGR
ncbi:MAG: tetratricopeptide repeat protein [bacterium]|nr:tetratricopeptide repeat protein [bacterium]